MMYIKKELSVTQRGVLYELEFSKDKSIKSQMDDWAERNDADDYVVVDMDGSNVSPDDIPSRDVERVLCWSLSDTDNLRFVIV